MADTILTHEQYRPEPYVRLLQALYGKTQRRPAPALDPAALDPRTATARIEHGRWIADCPAGCGSALLLSVEYPYYLCPECGAGWCAVTFPSDREAVESELVKRPQITTRNWLPGETLAQLQAENAAHGVA